MKANIKNKKCGFEPITIEVTFESFNEILEFYGRMNISNESVCKYGEIPKGCNYMPAQGDLLPLFSVARELVDKNK